MKINTINRRINNKCVDKCYYFNLEISLYIINSSNIKLYVKISYIYFDLIIFNSKSISDFDI